MSDAAGNAMTMDPPWTVDTPPLDKPFLMKLTPLVGKWDFTSYLYRQSNAYAHYSFGRPGNNFKTRFRAIPRNGFIYYFDIDHNTWLSIDSDAVGAFYQDSMQARPRVHNAKTEEFACAENGWRLSTPKGPNNALLYAWDSEQYATLKVKFELSA